MQQFIKENNLYWNSLGEFLTLSFSLKHISISKNYDIANIVYNSLNKVIVILLDNHKMLFRTIRALDT